jgi:potassium inwardly-rectifying channel subfamily J
LWLIVAETFVIFVSSLLLQIWWAIAAVNEDYRSLNETDWPVCVANVSDFPTALLFSVETQHTIGYGSRAIETNCPLTVIVLMLQSCYGVIVPSLMAGLIFAKLSRPKRRAQTMMFSKSAVICQRDHQYCLLFRLGDMRRSHIIGTSIRAFLVKNRLTREGESIPFCQYSLTAEIETNPFIHSDFGDNFAFLVWPVTVVHRIVKGSPLWKLSKEHLNSKHFEIIVIIEGIIKNTGMTTQFRTSYLPGEILWGYRLEPLVADYNADGQYDIDFKLFHKTRRQIPSMPLYSARESERNETVQKVV